MCHIAAILLARVAACWKSQTPYQLRDVDGRLIDRSEAMAIVAERHTVHEHVRRASSTTTCAGTDRRRRSHYVLHQPAGVSPQGWWK